VSPLAVADGPGSRLAAAVATVPAQATIMSLRSDLASRYGTAAVMGISRIATMSEPVGAMIALAKTTAMPARAIAVTADSTRRSARIRRG
jgi:hypothetical protein